MSRFRATDFFKRYLSGKLLFRIIGIDDFVDRFSLSFSRQQGIFQENLIADIDAYIVRG